MKDFFEIYSRLEGAVSSKEPVKLAFSGKYWSLIETDSSSGAAMSIPWDSREPVFPGGFEALSLREAARAARSWNLKEAALGLAAVNAALNTPQRMEELHCYEPFENYCTRGLDFRGKSVALIGHMHGPQGMREQAKEVFILEREPQKGDFPDSACDYILPRCDIVLISGSTLVNKTLPHLLELCPRAETILTGPSVPLCPELLELGISRLSGLVIEKREEMRNQVRNNLPGSPYFCGRPFLLMK